MARVALYQPGSVQREGVTGAKLQAADFGTSVLGQGLQRAGAALSDFVEKKDQIEALHDQQDAQRLDLEHVEQTRVLGDQLRQARGAGAQAEAKRLEGELTAYNRDLLTQARSPRARLALQDSIQRRSISEIDRYHSYADNEFVQDYRATSDARITALTEHARDEEDEGRAATAFAEVGGAIAERARFENWEGGATGPVAQQALLRQSTEFFIGRAQAIARQGNPQTAIDYATAHAEQIDGDHLDAFVGGLTEEAREQRMEERFAPLIGSATPAPQPAASSSPRAGRGAVALEGNNPGGLNDGSFARSQPGYTGSNGRYAAFRTMQDGVNAQKALLRSYVSRGFDTPAEIANRWAPRGDGRNDPAAYAQNIARTMGIGVNDRIGPAHIDRFANAQARQENHRFRPGMASGGGGAAGGGEAQASGQPSAASLETALAAVRDDKTLSYRDRQAAERVVRRRFGEVMAARDAREEEAGRGVDQWMVDHADDYTSTSQIPGFTQLSPSRQAALAERARQNRDGDRAISPELNMEYNYQQIANPRYFASPTFQRRLQDEGAPQSLLRQYGADAGRILGTAASQRAQNVTDQRLWSIADPILREMGLDFDRVNRTDGTRGPAGRELNEQERMTDARRKNQVLTRLREMSQIWTQAHPGQVPDDAIMRGWVGNSALQLRDGSYSFEANDQALFVQLANTPMGRQIAQELGRRNIPATPQNVLSAYRRHLALESARRQ